MHDLIENDKDDIQWHQYSHLKAASGKGQRKSKLPNLLSRHICEWKSLILRTPVGLFWRTSHVTVFPLHFLPKNGYFGTFWPNISWTVALRKEMKKQFFEFLKNQKMYILKSERTYLDSKLKNNWGLLSPTFEIEWRLQINLPKTPIIPFWPYFSEIHENTIFAESGIFA